METIVLCPEELCLGPTRFPHQANQALPGFPHVTSEYTIWTSGDLGKGTRFLPWKGTARIDMLPVLDKLPEFDVSHEILSWADILQDSVAIFRQKFKMALVPRWKKIDTMMMTARRCFRKLVIYSRQNKGRECWSKGSRHKLCLS